MRNHLLSYLFVCLLIGFTTGAPARADSNPTGEATDRVVFKRAAVASFFEGSHRPEMDESMDQTLSCPIGEICRTDPSIASHASITLTRLVDRELRSRYGKQILPRQRVRDAETEIQLNYEKDTPRTMAQRMGRLLQVEVVVIGTVWRYRDRGEMVGGRKRNASVAFAVYFIDATNGHKLWRGLYDATQKPVTENLFEAPKQIKMGLRWLSADELAAHGVKEVFETFPPNLLPGDFSGALQQEQEGEPGKSPFGPGIQSTAGAAKPSPPPCRDADIQEVFPSQRDSIQGTFVRFYSILA